MLTTISIKLGKLWNSDGKEELGTPKNVEMVFILKYHNLVIGYLKLKNGIWSYEYSEDFKNQTEIAVLPDFPDKNKIYSSEFLYPFFIQRIPSPSQPKVKETLEREKIKPDNIAELLKRFGRFSISNPFHLTVAAT
jgi:HipA-like protein